MRSLTILSMVPLVATLTFGVCVADVPPPVGVGEYQEFSQSRGDLSQDGWLTAYDLVSSSSEFSRYVWDR